MFAEEKTGRVYIRALLAQCNLPHLGRMPRLPLSFLPIDSVSNHSLTVEHFVRTFPRIICKVLRIKIISISILLKLQLTILLKFEIE